MENQDGYGNRITKILIVDDHPVVRYALTQVLNSEPDFSVVGIAENCAECFDKIITLSPDLVVLDLLMKDSVGSEAISQLRTKYPDIKIVVYSAYEDDWLVHEVISIGVDGYVIKNSDLSILTCAIRCINKGEKYLDPSVTSKVIQYVASLDNRQQQKRLLTSRERDVLVLIAKGYRNKQIAVSLFIEESTVKYHVNSIFTKLSVSNRIKAVLAAKQQGIFHE